MFRHQENRDLLVLEKAELLYSPFEKQTRLRTNFYLFYFAELVSEFCPEHERMPAVFRLLCNIEHSIQKEQNLDKQLKDNEAIKANIRISCAPIAAKSPACPASASASPHRQARRAHSARKTSQCN